MSSETWNVAVFSLVDIKGLPTSRSVLTLKEVQERRSPDESKGLRIY
jgi:hypothetical protein